MRLSYPARWRIVFERDLICGPLDLNMFEHFFSGIKDVIWWTRERFSRRQRDECWEMRTLWQIVMEIFKLSSNVYSSPCRRRLAYLFHPKRGSSMINRINSPVCSLGAKNINQKSSATFKDRVTFPLVFLCRSPCGCRKSKNRKNYHIHRDRTI